jgi:hypothetical protein
MELHLKFQQYTRKNWMRRHPQTRCKKLLEYDNYVILWLRNGFLPLRTDTAFSEISLLNHLTNTPHGDRQGTEVVTTGAGASIEVIFGITL